MNLENLLTAFHKILTELSIPGLMIIRKYQNQAKPVAPRHNGLQLSYWINYEESKHHDYITDFNSTDPTNPTVPYKLEYGGERIIQLELDGEGEGSVDLLMNLEKRLRTQTGIDFVRPFGLAYIDPAMTTQSVPSLYDGVYVERALATLRFRYMENYDEDLQIIETVNVDSDFQV